MWVRVLRVSIRKLFWQFLCWQVGGWHWQSADDNFGLFERLTVKVNAMIIISTTNEASEHYQPSIMRGKRKMTVTFLKAQEKLLSRKYFKNVK